MQFHTFMKQETKETKSTFHSNLFRLLKITMNTRLDILHISAYRILCTLWIFVSLVSTHEYSMFSFSLLKRQYSKWYLCSFDESFNVDKNER